MDTNNPPNYTIVDQIRESDPTRRVGAGSCSLCNNLEKRDEDDARLGFDFTPEEIVRTTCEGRCDSCTVILEGLRQSEDQDWAFQHDVRRVYARCHNKRQDFTETLCLEVYFADDRPKLVLEYYSLQPQAWKSILPRPTISGYPLSHSALSWVQLLLHECRSGHGACKDLMQPQLPKRVLSLYEHEHDTIFVKLIESNDEYNSYIALSHCWGVNQTCTTTKDDIESRKRGIAWDTIPKTFRDAIRFTLKLGIQHIWIDSLCILQDDERDWEIQSSKMADIYQSASLTLSATTSRGDSQGCFAETASTTSDLEIRIPNYVGACRIAVRKPLTHWHNLSSSQLKQQFPLLSRGWAFQERLLSPRVLHFCERELVWECRQISACECGGLGQGISPGGTYYATIAAAWQEHLDEIMTGQLEQEEYDWELALHLQNEMHEDVEGESGSESIPRATLSSQDNLFSPPVLAGQNTFGDQHMTGLPLYKEAAPSNAGADRYPSLIPQFHRIIEQYSGLGLTKQSDRLPALSGLCKRIQRLRGKYLAGLWSDSLCFDLMWRVDTLRLNGSDSEAPSQYRGPSWSWVSIDGPVQYWNDLTDFKDPLVPVQDIDGLKYVQRSHTPLGRNSSAVETQVDVFGHNPFGAVSSASIMVEASSVTATLLYTYDSMSDEWRHRGNLAHYKVKTSSSSRSDQHEIPIFADYVLGMEGPHKVLEGEAVTLLLVHPKVSLVLRMTTQGWKRIGIARISEGLLNYYGIDWMSGSEVKRFKLV